MTALVPSPRSIVLVALLALVRVPLAAQSGPVVARAFREANEVSILRDFTELVSYPNRARDTEDIRRTAAYIRDELRAVGVNSELLEIDGAPPIVFGERIIRDGRGQENEELRVSGHLQLTEQHLIAEAFCPQRISTCGEADELETT